MASRFKEDEKNERIIRGLLKLPDNRRCINCNSLGPQYVCINFSTFICTNCSGVHREFTHRVKSVSMAKFTSQEVSALQGGGNASAKEIYLKEWDPQHNSLPDGSNVERLRDFIKHVYVDRKYTGERGLPRGKGESVDLNENKRVDTYQGSSQSSGGRSPGYDLENRQHSDHKKNSSVEVINDWRREDRFGNGRRLEESRSFDGGSKVEIKSPDRRSDLDSPSPPVVRPVRDILGDSASPLRVIEPPKTIGGRPTDAHVQTQRAASSTSLASTNGIQAETSLIDFGDVLEPAQTTAVQQTHQLAKATPAPPPTSSGADNWANFESVPVKAATKANQLDVLSELMTPASSAPVGIFPPSSSTPIPAAVSPLRGFGLSAFPPAGVSAGQWPIAQPQHPALLVTGSQSLPHHSIPVVSGHPSSQQWNPIAPSGIAPTVDNKSVGRKELPADLFAATYPSMYPPVQGWYAAPPHGHGFPMQYNMQVQTPTVMQPSKSSNPFDTTNEPPPLQASTFPSVASLQGALPNMGHPQPPSYVSALPPSNFLYNPAGYGLGGAAYPAMNTNQQLGGGLHAAPAQNSFPPPAGNPFG